MSDWQNAELQNLGMYRGFIRLVVIASVLIAVTLAVMAIALL